MVESQVNHGVCTALVTTLFEPGWTSNKCFFSIIFAGFKDGTSYLNFGLIVKPISICLQSWDLLNSTKNKPPSLNRKNLCEASQWNSLSLCDMGTALFFLFNFCKSEKPDRLCDCHPLILVIVFSANLNMVFKMCLTL